MRLATYGSLAPGRPNEGQLSDLTGRWLAGHVRGKLVEAGWGPSSDIRAQVSHRADDLRACRRWQQHRLHVAGDGAGEPKGIRSVDSSGPNHGKHSDSAIDSHDHIIERKPHTGDPKDGRQDNGPVANSEAVHAENVNIRERQHPLTGAAVEALDKRPQKRLLAAAGVSHPVQSTEDRLCGTDVSQEIGTATDGHER
jgi:hypothetical protein